MMSFRQNYLIKMFKFPIFRTSISQHSKQSNNNRSCLYIALIILTYIIPHNPSMLRYSIYRPKLFKLSAVLLLICFGFTIYVAIEILILRGYQDELDNINNHTISQLFCSQLCADLPVQISANCCSVDRSLCEPKQTCLQSTISNYQALINLANDYIYYFSLPAVFFFVAFLIVLAYCIILRKKAEIERLQIDLEQALIANQEEMIMDEGDDEFDSYQDFVQYMLANGYLYQPKKKGDQRITSSFVTVDENSCPICMMEYRQQKVLTLNCGHKFHSSCIRDWNQSNSSCPICRKEIYQ